MMPVDAVCRDDRYSCRERLGKHQSAARMARQGVAEWGAREDGERVFQKAGEQHRLGDPKLRGEAFQGLAIAVSHDDQAVGEPSLDDAGMGLYQEVEPLLPSEPPHA